MKKINSFNLLFILMMISLIFVLSACETKPEEIYGKVVIHNEAGSGCTITRITITTGGSVGAPSTRYQERVSIAPGQKSKEYELELFDPEWFGNAYNDFYVKIIIDNDQDKSIKIDAYQNLINNLYYDGINFYER